ncbi:MAG: 50S ribosomal protein L31 [Firmicutes bacterium]|nr:50S ribosomal protein L31 [Bacillota bacterium]
MRPGIHPDYQEAQVTCVCGESFTTRSTKKEIRVEVCSKCHPFYTGQRQTVASTGGRIERFMKRYEKRASDAN